MHGVQAIKEIVSVFPRGIYRMSSRLADDKEDILLYSVLFEIFD